ncbi:ATP-binding protein [Marinomonas sp. THO17]|uniref:ATP-binding protein n=1 Tax=Marinomonas sp. THO17 TaxID=3149048 RepID=UPI00336C0593
MSLLSSINPLKMFTKKPSPILIFVSAAVIFMAAAMGIFYELVERQKVIMSAVEEDALWASYQLDREALRLRNSLTLYKDVSNESRLEEARNRFNILYSRLNVIKFGQLREMFLRQPNSAEVIEIVTKKLDKMDALLFADTNPVDIDTLLTDSNQILSTTETIVLDTLAIRSAEKVERRAVSYDLFIKLAGLIALLTITVMVIIYLLFRQLHLARESYRKSVKLTHELETAVQVAEDALKVKSDFMATMSHEIRTPMNAIIGFSYLLLEENLEEKVKEKVANIKTSADGLLHIINSILEFSKLESDHVELEETKFSLDQVLQYAYQVNVESAREHNIHFSVNRDFSIQDQLLGDQTRLQQIFVNLIGNAIKFTHEGRVDVRVDLQDSKTLSIEIQDTGVGIANGVDVFEVFKQADSSTTRMYGGTGLGLSITRQLVELLGGEIGYQSQVGKGTRFWVNLPYRPVNKASTRNKLWLIAEDKYLVNFLHEARFKGASLLSTEECEYLLADNDWNSEKNHVLVSYTYYSQLQSQSPFLYRALQDKAAIYCKKDLPKEGAAYSILVTPKEVSELRSKNKAMLFGKAQHTLQDSLNGLQRFAVTNKRILLAEDNLVNANIVKAIYEKIGIQVDWVDDGKKALDKVLAEHYDLVLMDIRMPVMDGYEATQAIRQALADNAPKILCLTADVVKVDEEQGKQQLFDDVMYKPLDHQLLIKKTMAILATATQADSASSSAELDQQQVCLAMDEIEQLLAAGDVLSESKVKQLIRQLYRKEQVEALEKVLKYISEYDFRDAMKGLKEFRRVYFS